MVTDMRVAGCFVSLGSKLAKLGILCGVEGKRGPGKWKEQLQAPHSSAAEPMPTRIPQRLGCSGNRGDAQNEAVAPIIPK